MAGRLGDTEINADKAGNLTARVVRNAKEVMRAMATVGGEPITSLDFCRSFFTKKSPTLTAPIATWRAS